MRILSHEKIPPRVMIKKITEETKSVKSGLTIRADQDALPKAEIVMVSDSVKGILVPGDRVYFMDSMRGKGKVVYQGSEHWVVDIGNIVSVYDSYFYRNVIPPFTEGEIKQGGSVYVDIDYNLQLFDELFSRMTWTKVDSHFTEIILSCRKSSFDKVNALLDELNAHTESGQGTFKTSMVNVERETLTFSRGNVILHLIVEDIDYDLFWPYKLDVAPKDCAIIL